jgi:mycothiol synthase
LGFQRIRTLIQMRSTLPSSLSSPPGIHTRPFIRHQDEEAWLALNARIFSAHPEQGQWTREDLERRLSEGWFDPDGFLIHESEGVMRGFCWTKVHGTHGHGHDVIGEIYVVGVDPAYQGRGLGRALTLAGLQHLTTAQVSGAMLYVDASNAAAIALYTDLGFSESGRDVMYRAPVTEVDQTKKRTGK